MRPKAISIFAISRLMLCKEIKNSNIHTCICIEPYLFLFFSTKMIKIKLRTEKCMLGDKGKDVPMKLLVVCMEDFPGEKNNRKKKKKTRLLPRETTKIFRGIQSSVYFYCHLSRTYSLNNFFLFFFLCFSFSLYT